jgi:cyclase
MLKKRIIAKLVVKDGVVVQSRNFKRYMPVGKPEIAVEFLDDWGVDEIMLLDISATRDWRLPDYAMMRSASARCHVPFTAGGGITSIEHIFELMHCGADKVSFNQVALHRPTLIGEAAKIFGDQCIVVSIDALPVDGNYRVYDYLRHKVLTIPVEEFAWQMQDRGAGEILINSVNRDGAQSGFDLDLINAVCSAVTIPVISCGGAGMPQHFIEVLEGTEVSAVAAANFFHFTEHSVTKAKAMISQHMPVRLDTHARYTGSAGRLLKKDEVVLEQLLNQRIEKEII